MSKQQQHPKNMVAAWNAIVPVIDTILNSELCRGLSGPEMRTLGQNARDLNIWITTGVVPDAAEPGAAPGAATPAEPGTARPTKPSADAGGPPAPAGAPPVGPSAGGKTLGAAPTATSKKPLAARVTRQRNRHQDRTNQKARPRKGQLPP